MVIKKYTVLVASILALQMSSFAQKSGWDWKDSSVIPVKSVSQFNEFKQNKNPYPAKPRNAWEIGVSGGPSFVIGDVNPKIGFGGSLTARKAINNIFSVRFGYYGSLNSGESIVYDYDGPSYIPSGTIRLGKYKTPNYKNKTHQLFTEVVASINTFSNYRGDPKANLYLLGGLGVVASGTSIDTGAGYRYVRGIVFRNNLLSFVTKKQSSQVFFLGYSFGLGFAYKINSQFNIGFEQRFSASVFPFTYVDGYRAPDGGRRNDIFSYSGFRINYNLLK